MSKWFPTYARPCCSIRKKDFQNAAFDVKVAHVLPSRFSSGTFELRKNDVDIDSDDDFLPHFVQKMSLQALCQSSSLRKAGSPYDVISPEMMMTIMTILSNFGRS